MANDINRITLIGRIVRDPELKQLQSGSSVANFSVASNRIYKTAGGDKKEEVSYFDCIAWGKLGELICEYCGKGKRIAIEGKLQQNRWEDQEGNKKSRIEIVADNVQFLDSRSQEQPENIVESGTDVTGNMDNPFEDGEIPF